MLIGRRGRRGGVGGEVSPEERAHDERSEEAASDEATLGAQAERESVRAKRASVSRRAKRGESPECAEGRARAVFVSRLRVRRRVVEKNRARASVIVSYSEARNPFSSPPKGGRAIGGAVGMGSFQCAVGRARSSRTGQDDGYKQ